MYYYSRSTNKVVQNHKSQSKISILTKSYSSIGCYNITNYSNHSIIQEIHYPTGINISIYDKITISQQVIDTCYYRIQVTAFGRSGINEAYYLVLYKKNPDIRDKGNHNHINIYLDPPLQSKRCVGSIQYTIGDLLQYQYQH